MTLAFAAAKAALVCCALASRSCSAIEAMMPRVSRLASGMTAATKSIRASRRLSRKPASLERRSIFAATSGSPFIVQFSCRIPGPLASELAVHHQPQQARTAPESDQLMGLRHAILVPVMAQVPELVAGRTIAPGVVAQNIVCAEGPFPLALQATASMSALPRAEKRFLMAMRIWSSAVRRSGSSDMIRSRKRPYNRAGCDTRLTSGCVNHV